jgi:hypothetical protein
MGLRDCTVCTFCVTLSGVFHTRDLLAKWWSSSRLETRTGESFVHASRWVCKPFGVVKAKVVLIDAVVRVPLWRHSSPPGLLLAGRYEGEHVR